MSVRVLGKWIFEAVWLGIVGIGIAYEIVPHWLAMLVIAALLFAVWVELCVVPLTEARRTKDKP